MGRKQDDFSNSQIANNVRLKSVWRGGGTLSSYFRSFAGYKKSKLIQLLKEKGFETKGFETGNELAIECNRIIKAFDANVRRAAEQTQTLALNSIPVNTINNAVKVCSSILGVDSNHITRFC